MWVIWVCVSEVVSILDFGKDMRWDRFIAFVDVATSNEYLSAWMIMSVMILVS